MRSLLQGRENPVDPAAATARTGRHYLVGAAAADELSDRDFADIAAYVWDAAAITISQGKEYLVQTRLVPVVRELGLGSLAELARRIRLPSEEALRLRVLDAMTTNETLWFRDILPWKALQDSIVPEIVARRRGQRTLNVWCGASSSGQEPYTLSMTLADAFPELASWRRTFVGTDISETMLTRCRDGVYSQLEINRGLPATALVRHFDRLPAGYRVKPAIRDPWEFRRLNLSRHFPPFPPLDLVLLRNVLINFDDAMKRDVIRRVRHALHPDGWLAQSSRDGQCCSRSRAGRQPSRRPRPNAGRRSATAGWSWAGGRPCSRPTGGAARRRGR